MRLKNVHGASYAKPVPVQHMRLDHGRRNMAVPQDFLHCADMVAILQEMSGERMPEDGDMSLLPGVREMMQANFAPDMIEKLEEVRNVLR